MAQLFNLKFFLYLCWLGVGVTPLRASRRTLADILTQNKLIKTLTKNITFENAKKTYNI